MKGETIKKILAKDGISVMDLAGLMQVNPQLVYASLSRDDIKTSLLEKIASATGKTPSYYYNDGNEEYSQEVEQLKEENERLNKIIIALTK